MNNKTNEHELSQVPEMYASDIQITAMSEFIGRHALADSLIKHAESSGDYLPGVPESAQQLYDVYTRQPISIGEVVNRRNHMLEEKKIEPMTGAYRREQLFAKYPNGFSDEDTVLAVDVAGLKLLNENYGGHKAGDSALITAVSSIKRAFPESEAFRMGGDEFVVVTKEQVSSELWNRVNDEYVSAFNTISGNKVSSDETFLRAGVVYSSEKAEMNGNKNGKKTEDVVAEADVAEVKIRALIEILGTDKGVPLLASMEEIDTWLAENNTELVDKGNKIVAYRTYKAGKRKILPKYLKKRGSSRVRGR